MASIIEQESTFFAVGGSQRLAMFFWLIIVIIGLPTASAFTCYCEGSYCNNDRQNGTCETRKKGYCFSAVEEVWDDSQEKLVLNYSFGCLPPGIQGYMQCKGYMLPHFKANSIYCCKGYLCNKEVVPVPKGEPTPTVASVPVPVPMPAPGLFKENTLTILVAMILIFWAMVTSFLVIVYFLYRLRSRKTCLMLEASSSNLDKKSIVSEPPIFFFGSKGKPLALPYIHIDSNVKNQN